MATATTPNYKGITAKDITGMMNRLEKRIDWFNKKYRFGTLPATAKDQKEYDADLRTWDLLKVRRDELKAQA